MEASAPFGLKQCFSCKGCFPDVKGPVHKYMDSTPGCWAAFGRALAMEFQDPEIFAAVHHFTVDAYAVQHPGRNERKAVQSVTVHLTRLYGILEKGWVPKEASRVMSRLLGGSGNLGYLEPPDFSGCLNVNHLTASIDAGDYIKRAREWAEDVWRFWKGKHFGKITAILDI